jgi:DNA-binding transcriptional regulator YhcF (GntR family)
MAQDPDAPARLAVDRRSPVPKYRQLVDQVCRGIRDGALRRGNRLPSINALGRTNGLSRDTVVKAYNRLKAMGVLASAHGKAFSIATDRLPGTPSVLLLFDTFTPYKETVYEAMRAEAAGRLELDIWFHHFRPDAFGRVLADARGRYASYVVMAFPHETVRRALAAADPERLLLFDIDVDVPGRRCAAVLQSHDRGLFEALGEAEPRLRAYRSVTLAFPPDKHHPAAIPPAFRRFCRARRLAHRVVDRVDPAAIRPGEAWFVIEDADLVALVQAARRDRLRIGRDLGILSYNDTPMKAILEPGMSVVSIDFAELGRKAVRQILDPSAPRVVTEPTRFISRGSL